jgi:beta-aspartyl-peptidase (threonine type)
MVARWSIAIHGGAGTILREKLSDEQRAKYEAGLSAALDAGAKDLAERGNALDAVTAAVVLLEDDPLFNAGRGATFTFEGGIELDAAIMDGRTRAAGAVAGVTSVKNPVLLARAVMEQGTHVFLCGAGAERFAREHDIEAVDPVWFETPERRRQLEEFRQQNSGWFDSSVKYGTVGAVARDSEGHVAAATSTGGLTGKRWGRIGDSPVIGAGTYADDRAGAVSATGAGEYFIRSAAAKAICDRMRLLGEGAQAAADAVIAEIGDIGGHGGVIVAGANGSPAFALNTAGMYRGRADSEGLREIAIFGDE